MSTPSHWKTNPEYADYDAFREKLILAAAAIMEEEGVDRLRLADVAKRCGCVRQTVYRYFNSKQEITQAVLLHVVMEAAAQLSSKVVDIKTAEDRLVEIIYQGASMLAANPVISDSRNMRLFTGLTAETFAGFLDGYRFDSDELVRTLTNRDISAADLYRWLTMQIIALVNLGMTGGDTEAERSFIRNLIIRGPL